MNQVLRFGVSIVVPTLVTIGLCATDHDPGMVGAAIIGFVGALIIQIVLQLKYGV